MSVDSGPGGMLGRTEGLEAPESGVQWMKLDREGAPERVVILGPPRTYWAHFYPVGRRRLGARCRIAEGVRCPCCDSGHDRRARYVLPVLRAGQVAYLEVGRVQYPHLLALAAVGPWYGQLVEVSRERPGMTSPIKIVGIGRAPVAVDVVDVRSLVAGLGIRELAVVIKLGLVASTPSPNGRSAPVERS